MVLPIETEIVLLTRIFLLYFINILERFKPISRIVLEFIKKNKKNSLSHAQARRKI